MGGSRSTAGELGSDIGSVLATSPRSHLSAVRGGPFSHQTRGVGTCGYRIVAQSILTTEFGAWYGRSSLIAVLLVSALAIWAFRVSLGTRPLMIPRGAKA